MLSDQIGLFLVEAALLGRQLIILKKLFTLWHMGFLTVCVKSGNVLTAQKTTFEFTLSAPICL